jgi:hypothetical protein
MPDCRLQNVRALDRLSFETAQWAFPLVVTLHNLEEAVWLPRFWQNRSWHLPITAREFRIVTALVAILAYFLTYLSVRNGKKSIGAYMVATFSAIMLLNAIWHVIATVYVQTYAPGVVTAVLLILPVTVYVLKRALREGYI